MKIAASRTAQKVKYIARWLNILIFKAKHSKKRKKLLFFTKIIDFFVFLKV